MSIFALGDLHLSFSADKSMHVFKGWDNYTQRIKENWEKTVGPDDTVVLVGDISWGMSEEECLEDFRFIDSLPGKKIILKGNHDYWFNTKSKAESFWQKNGFSTLYMLHNNFYEVEGVAVCGTRGWIFESSDVFTQNDKKIIMREAARLETSLKEAHKKGLRPIAFLHYPPVFSSSQAPEIIDVMKKYSVEKCFYGHIHASGAAYAKNGLIDGIEYRLVSCDYTDFTPVLVSTFKQNGNL